MNCPECRRKIFQSEEPYLLDSGYSSLWFCKRCFKVWLIHDYSDRKGILYNIEERGLIK